MSDVYNIESLDDLVVQADSIVARYKLYNGEVELLYDDDEHLYCTEVDGERFPAYGVTNITGCADKPALKPWVAKVVYDRTMEKIMAYCGTTPLTPGIHIDLETFEELMLEAKGYYRDISDTALDIGHIAHSFIEDYLKAQIAGVFTGHEGMLRANVLVNLTETAHLKVPKDDEHELHIGWVDNCIEGALAYLSAHNFRPIKAEYKLYSRDYNYAGTTDAKGLMDSCSDPECCKIQFKNWLVIADWKSSRDFYIEYRYQAAAYDHADEEESGDVKDARVVVILGKYEGQTVKGVVLPNTDQDDDFGAFLGLMAYFERGQVVTDRDRTLREAAKLAKKLAKEQRELVDKAEKVAERLRVKASKKEALDLEKLEAKRLKDEERARLKAEKLASKEAKKVMVQ